MKNLLIIGINTRCMINSGLKLDYNLFSTSYFSTADTPKIKNQKIILEENEDESCGIFEEKFNSKYILEISKDYINQADYIIPLSGISPADFSKKYQKKILGSINIENVENKFEFYNEIKDEFNTPETFKLNDVDEAIEISKNNKDIKYIIKPIKGSGGYDIKLLNNNPDIQLKDNEFIMQEYIEGINLSSSILASENTAKAIMNSRLLTENDFKNNNNYRYVGNITPLDKKSILCQFRDIDKINKEIKLTSEKLATKFNLLGSNGIDYIINENGLYVIEVNPRIQGTFECIENTLGINMLEAHIKACQNELIDIEKAKYYSYKKIIYSPTTMKYNKINLDNIYDLPHIGSITEKNEPLLTIIDKDKNFEKLYEKVETASKKVNNAAIKHQLNIK